MIGDFREVVQDCNLRGLGYLGHSFTWSNRRFGCHLVEELWIDFCVVKTRQIIFKTRLQQTWLLGV